MMDNDEVLEIEILDKIKAELIDNCEVRHRGAYGGRGSGKSWSIARILLIMGMERECFIVCVREVQKSIEHSVMKLLKDTIKLFHLEPFYTVRKNDILGKNGTKFIFQGLHEHSSDSIKSLEGADICWVAEAQSISRTSIDILRPTIRKPGSIVFWDFNPRYSSDPVYVDYIRHQPENAKFVNVNWWDNPWFPEELEQEKAADYKRDEERAKHIWEGELVDADALFVCPSALVDKAVANNILKTLPVVPEVGADIAHQGGDEIVFYKRIGDKVVQWYCERKQNAIKTFNDLRDFVGDKRIPIKIDNGHLGAAIADMLEEDGWNVHRINFGGTPKNTKHYEDVGTELYFDLKDKLEFIDIPYDNELMMQLSDRKYMYINGKRGQEVMKLEPKKDFAEHTQALHKSPDRADALALCFYEPQNTINTSGIAGMLKGYSA